MSSTVAFDVFRAISDPSRRAILDHLREGEMTVGDLVARFSMTQSAISQHLRILRDSHLVQVQKDGRLRRYRLDCRPLIEIYDWVAHYERFWQEKLDALDDFLEETDV